MMVDPDLLVGVAEIADAAGVTRGRVSQWVAAGTLEFPDTVAHVASGPLWLWPDVLRWLENTNRPRPDGAPMHSPMGPYDRLAAELAEVDGYRGAGLTMHDACTAVATARAHELGLPVRTMTARLRHLYPGWRARQRATRGNGPA